MSEVPMYTQTPNPRGGGSTSPTPRGGGDFPNSGGGVLSHIWGGGYFPKPMGGGYFPAAHQGGVTSPWRGLPPASLRVERMQLTEQRRGCSRKLTKPGKFSIRDRTDQPSPAVERMRHI